MLRCLQSAGRRLASPDLVAAQSVLRLLLVELPVQLSLRSVLPVQLSLRSVPSVLA